ncbi:MAG: hypothetical protein HZC04_00580 [Candidatus Lloydbacteria bacterium]|nr:hypothetical protein [Candidatus Lloydbacteria bacterium]
MEPPLGLEPATILVVSLRIKEQYFLEPPPGLEPGTYGLQNRCSFLLSPVSLLPAGRSLNIGDFLPSAETGRKAK